MPFFPNTEVELFEEVVDATLCGVDGYGNPKKCLVSRGKFVGDFQPMNPMESMREFGSVVQGLYKLYLAYGVVVKANYKIKANYKFYQVSGDPSVRRTLIPHVKVNLQEER
jgi:hypothetical protein